MPRQSQPAGPCPECSEGEVVCSYNFFDRKGLVIHSWEHKCGNCGLRNTTAYRSDDDEIEENVNPAVCPYCERQGETSDVD